MFETEPETETTLEQLLDDECSPEELLVSIEYLRSLPTGSRWSWRTMRRESYGPSPTLMSWVEHTEDMISQLHHCHDANRCLLSKFDALYVRCLMAEGHAKATDDSIAKVREHFALYTGPPGHDQDKSD